MIIGAGTGGLCLAHGLAANGIAVEVFERDDSPTDRSRAIVSASARPAAPRSAVACRMRTTASLLPNPRIQQQGHLLDHELNELLPYRSSTCRSRADDAERPVSRAALRRILLEGVEHIVRFGRKFEAFADGPGGTVIARFADGSAAEGDLLVGADGANSRMRAQLLPQAKRIDTGMAAVAGKSVE